MLLHALRDFAHLCRVNKMLVLLSGFCLICAFVSFLFLQEKGYHEYNVNVEQQMETQLLYLKSNDTTTVKSLLDEIAYNAELPPLGLVTVSDDNYSGVYWNREWDNAVWYTPYGRFFSREEMDSFSRVVMLGMSYIRQLPHEKMETIWEEGITINGEQFIAIGSYDDWGDTHEEIYQTTILPNPIAIPVRTYFDMGFEADRIRVVFTNPLTTAQIADLDRMVGSLASVDYCLLPKTSNENAISTYVATTVQYSIILILALMSTTSIVLYWLRKEFSRYKIYMILGAKPSQIIFFISVNIFSIISISFACACFLIYGITFVIPNGLIDLLPIRFFAIIYLCIMCFSLIVVNLRALPDVVRNKMYVR